MLLKKKVNHFIPFLSTIFIIIFCLKINFAKQKETKIKLKSINEYVTIIEKLCYDQNS